MFILYTCSNIGDRPASTHVAGPDPIGERFLQQLAHDLPEGRNPKSDIQGPAHRLYSGKKLLAFTRFRIMRHRSS